MHTAFNASLLKLERERRGWSQTFLAERLDVKQAALSKRERGVVERLRRCKSASPKPSSYLSSSFVRKRRQFRRG